MKIKITILENHSLELNHLKTQIETWSIKSNVEVELLTFLSGEQYFNSSIHSPESTNVFFLDIQLNTLTGLDVARQLRRDGYKGYIIFITAFREYVFHGYEVHALNYLLKPIQQKSLSLCLDEIAKNLTNKSYLYRNKHETICIPYHDILCFSSSLHYVDILTVSNDYHQFSTLKNVMTLLPPEFIQTHRSFIVNIAHIYKLSENTITLSNNMTVPVGRSFLKQVGDKLLDYSSRFDITGGIHR